MICPSELPTRVCESSKTLIDLFCVNNKHRVVQTEVISSSIKDHSIIMCVFKSGVPKLPSRTYESRTFKNYVKEAFLKDLANVPWHVIDRVQSADDALFL